MKRIKESIKNRLAGIRRRLECIRRKIDGTVQFYDGVMPLYDGITFWQGFCTPYTWSVFVNYGSYCGNAPEACAAEA